MPFAALHRTLHAGIVAFALILLPTTTGLERRQPHFDVADSSKHEFDVSPAVHLSDEEFRKDFAQDVHPPVDTKLHKFAAPYPIVQDSYEFDKDFVKDENSDGGEWKAQMAYDEARHKLQQKKEDVQTAREGLEHQQQELADAQAKENVAENARKEAQELSRTSRDQFEDAQAAAERIRRKWRKSYDGIAEGVQSVKREVSELEECKQELLKAKEELQNLLQNKLDKDKQFAQELARAITDAEAKVAVAQDQLNAAVAKAEQKRKIQADLQDKADETEKKHQAAVTSLEEQRANAAHAEDALSTATTRLQRTRYDGNDRDGSTDDKKGGSQLSRGLFPRNERSRAATSAKVVLALLVALVTGAGFIA